MIFYLKTDLKCVLKTFALTYFAVPITVCFFKPLYRSKCILQLYLAGNLKTSTLKNKLVVSFFTLEINFKYNNKTVLCVFDLSAQMDQFRGGVAYFQIALSCKTKFK